MAKKSGRKLPLFLRPPRTRTYILSYIYIGTDVRYTYIILILLLLYIYINIISYIRTSGRDDIIQTYIFIVYARSPRPWTGAEKNPRHRPKRSNFSCFLSASPQRPAATATIICIYIL